MKNWIEVFMITAFAFIGYQVGYSEKGKNLEQRECVNALVGMAKDKSFHDYMLFNQPQDSFVLILLVDDQLENGKKVYSEARRLTRLKSR